MEENFAALEKYNFWDGNVPEMGFYRETYTDKIFDYTGSKLIKVLVGQRRAGKSYILRQIANKLIEDGINCKIRVIPDTTTVLFRTVLPDDSGQRYRFLADSATG